VFPKVGTTRHRRHLRQLVFQNLHETKHQSPESNLRQTTHLAIGAKLLIGTRATKMADGNRSDTTNSTLCLRPFGRFAADNFWLSFPILSSFKRNPSVISNYGAGAFNYSHAAKALVLHWLPFIPSSHLPSPFTAMVEVSVRSVSVSALRSVTTMVRWRSAKVVRTSDWLM
jgi:hypothetical protein